MQFFTLIFQKSTNVLHRMVNFCNKLVTYTNFNFECITIQRNQLLTSPSSQARNQNQISSGHAFEILSDFNHFKDEYSQNNFLPTFNLSKNFDSLFLPTKQKFL
jgi:hypothetical protein